MSMSMSYYVGPYLKLYYHLVDKEKTKYGCPNCNNEREWSNNFCKECGTKIGEYKVVEKEHSANYWEWVDELIDNTMGDLRNTGEIDFEGFDILHARGIKINSRDSYFRDSYFNYEDGGNLQEIKKEDIEKEIEWFKNEYKKWIDLFETKYDKVEIKWGIVRSLS